MNLIKVGLFQRSKKELNRKLNNKTVYCIELDREFESVKLCAEELKLPSSSIAKVCRGVMKDCRGYHFIYTNNNNEYMRKEDTFKKRKIAQYLDGELIKVWESLKKIKRELGYDYRLISKCCKGERDSYKGYSWEYYN